MRGIFAVAIDRIRRTQDKVKPFFSLSKRAKTAIIVMSLILMFFSIFLPIMLASYYIPTIKLSREYKVGELSDETVYSPVDFSFIDKVATERLYDEAEKSVLPQITYSVSSSMLAKNRAQNLEAIFSKTSDESEYESFLSKFSLDDQKDVIHRLSSMDNKSARVLVRLIEEGVSKIMSDGLFSEEGKEQIKQEGYSMVDLETADSDYNISRKKVPLSDLLTREDLSSYILNWISSVYPALKGSAVELIADGVSLIAVENLSYDEVLTKTKEDDAKKLVEPVLVDIKKGDELLSVDKIVTEEDLRTINEINSRATLKVDVLDTIGKIVYVAVVITMFLYIFFQSLQYKYRIAEYTLITLSLTIFILITSYFIVAPLLNRGIDDIDSFLPFLILPMIVSAIANNKVIGFTSAVFYASIQNISPTSNIYTFFYIISCSIVCLYFINFNNDRIRVITQCIISACAVAIVTALFTILEDMSFENALMSVGGSILNTISTHILMSIILPIFERIFNIPTGYRLHELSYADSPTLNRLNQVALGTYNHSKNVSDMAYNAAKAIKVNAELARVGGLYHDIGKIEHPEYFIENQIGKNVHEDLSPTLSAAVIKSHVKIGIEKAKEIGLPQEVIDIIGEHHGNDLIKYFYNEAVKNNKLGASVSEEDFRYTGRIPSTPESAIVMLSDCVEAATRTIKNPNRQKYEKFISNIILDKINHNQLDNSKLTITDLDIIKESFIHQLMGRDHHRIEYDNGDNSQS